VRRSAVPALWVLTCLAAAIFLRTASELFIPIVVAVLASYALEPIVRRLHALRIPRAVAAGVLLGALVVGAGTVLYAIRTDIGDAAAALPQAMRRLGEWMGAGTVARQAERTVRSPEMIQQAAGWVAAAAGQKTIVVFLTYFLLISGQHFKRRLVELAGPRLERQRVTVEVLDDITEQIQRFLLVQVFTSAIVAVATWLVLAWAGVEQAAVWSILAGNGVLVWTWIWGPWGTVLAVPMMAAIRSIADHVEPLRPVSRLLAQ
jgi:predicted PurR-regulated permease PerM